MDASGREPIQGVTLRQRVFSVPAILSLVIAIAFIVFLSTRIDLDWSDTWANIRSMNPGLYLAGIALYYLSFVFRGWRWRILARNAGEHAAEGARLPPVFHFTRLIMIGWFVNSIAYLRLGDAYRAYAFSQDSGGGFPWALGTLLAERVVDVAAVFVLLAVAAFTFSATTESSASTYVLLASALLLVSLAGVVVVMKYYGQRIARRLPERFERAYRDFQQGAIGSFKRIPVVFGLGLVGWGLEVGRLYFVVVALGLDMGLPLLLIVSLGHALLSTVPIPGGVGVVEPGITGLLMLSLDRSDAVSVALVDRSITYVSVIVIGGLAFMWRQLDRPQAHRWEPVTVGSGAD